MVFSFVVVVRCVVGLYWIVEKCVLIVILLCFIGVVIVCCVCVIQGVVSLRIFGLVLIEMLMLW